MPVSEAAQAKAREIVKELGYDPECRTPINIIARHIEALMAEHAAALDACKVSLQEMLDQTTELAGKLGKAEAECMAHRHERDRLRAKVEEQEKNRT